MMNLIIRKYFRKNKPQLNSNLSKIKRRFNFKINWKYLAKIIVVLISFFGFFYQSLDYFVKFFNYPTFVDVRNERSRTIDIPSVTICIPSLTSRSILSKTYPEINEKLEELRKSGDKSWTHDERQVFQIYQNMSSSRAAPQQFFDLGIHAQDIIECLVLRPQHFEEMIDNWIPCTNVSDVLETIGPNGKCFTYFTKLNQKGSQYSERKFKIDIYKNVRDQIGLAIDIKVTFNASDYIDMAKIGDESITLHEGTGIPTEVKRRRLKAGTTYDIYFTKILTTNLPLPYKTDCINYQMFNSLEPQSRVDCVDRCVKDIYYDQCNCYPLHVVVRHDIVINRNLSLCNETNPILNECKKLEVKSRCFEKCKLDCNEISYDFDTEEDVYPSDSELQEAEDEERVRLQKIRNFTAIIKLWRKVSGDTLYEYKVELPLVQLFSFVGGLASLWLGISFIAFYDIMVKIATLVYKTKPFEKMRRRDAAQSVLSKWNIKSKNNKKAKLMAQIPTISSVNRLPRSPLLTNNLV